MPRRLRIEMPGGVYHVTNRGVDRMDIVRNDADRHEWWRLLDRTASRCGWRVFAHVLMTNHFHLFLKTPEPNLSAGMHAVESGHATLFNKRHERVGPLFQGRFHAVLIEAESHAWEVSRYVHLNPCRANLAPRPEAYRWSTYRHYLDPHGSPEWLDWRTILAEFGGTEAAARIAYRRFMDAGFSNRPLNPFASAYGGVLLGGPEFIERYRGLVDHADFDPCQPKRRTTVTEILSAVAVTWNVSPAEILAAGRHGNLARETAIWLCRELVSGPLDVIAAQFGGVSRSSITDTVRRCEQRQSDSAEFRRMVEATRHQCESANDPR